jgi:flagellar biosynthesis protein FlhG
MLDQATQLRRLVEARGVVEMKPARAEPARHSPESISAGLVTAPPRPRAAISHGPPRAIDFVPRESSPVLPRRIARAIAVTSGKGGVGKSNLAVNLSVALAARGRRVCLIDADLGLANADVLCSVTPRFTLDDVVHERCRLGEALIHAPGAFQLLPGASGVTRMADLTAERQSDLIRRLSILERATDLIVIDTGAGINRNVLSFAAAAHTVLVTVTPEPTSITDGYGLIKALLRRAPDARIEVIVNMCAGAREAAAVFERINRVSKAFLNQPLRFGGFIPEDDRVRDSVHQRLPFTLLYPKCAAARKVIALAGRCATLYDAPAGPDAASAGFFARLLRRSMRKK